MVQRQKRLQEKPRYSEHMRPILEHQNDSRNPLWKRWQLWVAVPLVLLLLALGYERFSEYQVRQQIAAEKQFVDERCREEVTAYAKYPGGGSISRPNFLGVHVGGRGRRVLPRPKTPRRDLRVPTDRER